MGILKINWQCYGGYGGKDRPQVANLDEQKLLDCETHDEVKEVIENTVEEDFRNKVSYSYDEIQMADIYQRWQELKAERQAEDDEEYNLPELYEDGEDYLTQQEM